MRRAAVGLVSRVSRRVVMRMFLKIQEFPHIVRKIKLAHPTTVDLFRHQLVRRSSTMSTEVRFLNLFEAAAYLGRSPRWMRRHYADLIRAGAVIYRAPKDSLTGRIMFEKSGLDQYVQNCRIQLASTQF